MRRPSTIAIDLARVTGRIKPLHGVNNGPVGYGSLVDVSHYYRMAGIPLVRLHDPNWPHPREIDIHTIFPDFSQDPSDPASYDFSRSDAYVRLVLDTGARIVWRLGESIEHTETKYYVHPPADYAKWTEICLGIIRHYNHGWAGGYHYGIEYWEIWNEPEGGGGRMWSGTVRQYYDLYRSAAPAIKAFDPSLKVGGYAAALPMIETEFFDGFLRMCRDEGLPLDFFSWHLYTDDPLKVRELSLFVRERLDRNGFHGTESHYNEWNFFDADWATLFLPGNEHVRRDLFERGKGPAGASFAAAVLMELQDCPVDAANYYDGQPSALFCGLFDYYGVPQKTYYAFEAFHQLSLYPYRAEVHVEKSLPGLYACCGKNDRGEAAVLISHYGEEPGFCEISVQGWDIGGDVTVEEYRLDGERSLELERTYRLPAGAWELFLPQHSVCLLKMGRGTGETHAHENDPKA